MTFLKDSKPRWADGTPPVGDPHIEEPSEAKKDIGWKALEKPFRQWMNWLFNKIYVWLGWNEAQINYIESVTTDSANDLVWNSATDQLTFTADINIQFMHEGTWYTNTIPLAGSPLTISDGQALVAIVDTDDVALTSEVYADMVAGNYCVVDKASMLPNDNFQEIVICHRIGTALKFSINKQLVPSSNTFKLSAPSGYFDNIFLKAAGKLYLDGGGNTYLQESSADVLDVYVGGANYLKITHGSTKAEFLGCDVELDTGKKLFFDGGSNTYIYESASDVLDFYVGSVKMMSLVEGAIDYVEVTAPAGLLLPDTDPPTANHMTRSSGVRAWLEGSVIGDIVASYNISSLSLTSTGHFTVSWDKDFSNEYYCVNVTCELGNAQIACLDNKTSGLCYVKTLYHDGNYADSGIYLTAIGDQ